MTKQFSLKKNYVFTKAFPSSYWNSLSRIDKAIVEIKSKNETIVKMEKDMKDIMNENRQLADIKAELLNLERKNTQKT